MTGQYWVLSRELTVGTLLMADGFGRRILKVERVKDKVVVHASRPIELPCEDEVVWSSLFAAEDFFVFPEDEPVYIDCHPTPFREVDVKDYIFDEYDGTVWYIICVDRDDIDYQGRPLVTMENRSDRTGRYPKVRSGRIGLDDVIYKF